MPKKGKICYSAKEVRTIFYMKEKGYRPREIAERLGRSTHAIEMFLQRYRPRGLDEVLTMTTDEETPSLTAALDAIPAKTVDVVKEEQAKEEELTNLWGNAEEIEIMPPSAPSAPSDPDEPRVICIVKTVIDDSCSDDELIRTLHKRGYRVEGKLVRERVIKDEVCLKDIINNG